jgi:hypothetical protein
MIHAPALMSRFYPFASWNTRWQHERQHHRLRRDDIERAVLHRWNGDCLIDRETTVRHYRVSVHG